MEEEEIEIKEEVKEREKPSEIKEDEKKEIPSAQVLILDEILKEVRDFLTIPSWMVYKVSRHLDTASWESHRAA